MAESTADVITFENEESENLVELYKSKFDYCSEKAAIIEICLQICKNIDNELVLRRSFKYWKRRLRKFDIF